ncbi:NAD(P)-dependent alcohol dehydrogenase [Nitrospinae bacterium]|nr:NAD(P)-dependent alcohol dehydrogenase [Nitrospinota bacterium]
MFQAYAASEAKSELKLFEYEPGALASNEVQIKVETCGICHSDLSMLNNDWGISQFPLVPGHEVIGIVESLGAQVKHLKIGQRVGVGWFSNSCMTCEWCVGGEHNLCESTEGIIVGRHGGFADRVRTDATWAIPIPDGINPESAGPLMCGGITVFNPILQFNIKPTDHVGIIGIGGLGHMALKFLHSYGCEVTAFSSNEEKENDAKIFGANHFVNSSDSNSLEKIAGSLDFIISTVNVALDWPSYINVLRPKGRLHIVGAVMEPLPIPLFPLLFGQKSVSASPLGSPFTAGVMLEFAARHKIEPLVETYPIDKVNEAMEKLRSGKTRYRLVLKNNN